MSLKARITEDMKAAMRAKDSERLLTIRMLLAAIKQREVDERIELNDEQVLGVVEKLIKQRKDAAGQYTDAGRQELADKELAEAALLQGYLPEPLSEAQIDALIEAAVAETGAEGPKDMGKVIGQLRPTLQGRADMGQVSAKVKAYLAGLS
ncbi:MAG: GatB/YqeY domain-containing protein [Pseudomonadota bacterium]|uniref:GatB/YqeY domain-containing protein n=1 Tax=Thermithiobacillus tepidarius TaxID=929 RepID=UPI00040C029F|nr:GatB/YqeY domain-containing protein [Thermithiobacillus tepidarius]